MKTFSNTELLPILEVYGRMSAGSIEEQKRKLYDFLHGIRNDETERRVENATDPLVNFINGIKLENSTKWRELKADYKRFGIRGVPDFHRISAAKDYFGPLIRSGCKNAGLHATMISSALNAMCLNSIMKEGGGDRKARMIYEAFRDNGKSLSHAISAFTGKSLDEVESMFGPSISAAMELPTHDERIWLKRFPMDRMISLWWKFLANEGRRFRSMRFKPPLIDDRQLSNPELKREFVDFLEKNRWTDSFSDYTAPLTQTGRPQEQALSEATKERFEEGLDGRKTFRGNLSACLRMRRGGFSRNSGRLPC